MSCIYEGTNRQFLEADGNNEEFLEADGDNEERAFELLFNTYHQIVFNKIDKMMRDHLDPAVDADDITNETFIKAFKKRHQVREPEKLLGWLLTIAENLTRNEIRDAGRRRRAGDLSLESFDSLSIGERDAHYATSLSETDAEQVEANKYLARQFLCLLQGKDRKVAALKFEGAEIDEIAETVGPTAEAVQKRWERILEWAVPIVLNLEKLVDCLPEENDRKIMERYLDEQPLSDIAKAVGISLATVEKTVERVIAQWKKAAKENSTDPVSAMVKNER